jgi:hypothetical protein
MTLDFTGVGSRSSARVCIVVLILLLLALTAFTQSPSTAPPQASGNMQSGPSSPTQNGSAPPKASAVYKNLRLFQDLPANEIVPSMQFIAASLGVGCNYCHVEGSFDKDDKKPKQTARKMIEMVRSINTNSFNGEREVTCNSCHRGAAKVVAIPAVGPRAASGEKEHPAAPAAVEQVWQRYLQALGGPDALQKITTRVEKGIATIGGRQFPVESYSQSADKRSVLLQLPNGHSITTLDGDKGWAADSGRGVRAMTSGEVDAAKLDAALQFPRALTQWGYELRAVPPEQLNDKPADVLVVRGREGAIGRLYFDPQSGLLVRAVRYANTPLGKNPLQVDYSDYRDEHGVKVPFTWTVARPGGSYTVQLESVQLNAPVDAKRFQMPQAEKASASSPH